LKTKLFLSEFKSGLLFRTCGVENNVETTPVEIIPIPYHVTTRWHSAEDHNLNHSHVISH